MKIFKMVTLSTFLGFALLLTNCGDDDDSSLIDKALGLEPKDDVELGREVKAQIEADTAQFPILPRADYPEAYAYIENMTSTILQSDDVNYKDIFAYEVKIVNKDVLNAFATPGGFIYVYTGLIKYLDQADDLAGVMGHEIAHASQRHSIEQLKKQVGVQFLISIALGEGAAADVAALASNFLSLKFSRDDEADSDDYSVLYLADTDYACNGAATFFEKLESEGGNGVPEFLSTHPSPANRVEDINAQATEVGCATTPVSEMGMTYEDFKNSLP